jgi:hypothetical protein
VLAKAHRDERELDAAAEQATIAVRDIGTAVLPRSCLSRTTPRYRLSNDASV